MDKLELLLEIYSEEIPARLQRFAVSNFAQQAKQTFADLGCVDVEIYTECSARRLVLCVKNLPSFLPESSEEIRGPRVSAPSKALDGFMGKYKINSVNELQIVGDFYLYNKITPSKPVKECCSDIIPKLLKDFTWPKSMRWGQSGKDTWIRPIRSIACIFNGEVVNFEYAGIKSGNYSFGHRVLAPNNKFEVIGYEDYKAKLKDLNVLLDFEQRRNVVMQNASETSKKYNITLLEDTELLEEVLGLSECPNPMIGVIDNHFMKLPFEVLVSTIKSHQKYIMFCKNGSSLELSEYFMIVADGKYHDNSLIIEGNQRVLKARLSDAEFFYKNDLSTGLSSMLDALKHRVFHSEIGSVYDKIERMRKIGLRISSYFGLDTPEVDKAILLCKCDLVSEMVFEFPELQGIMGCYYAIAEGCSENVASAIRDHYKPQGPSDSLPSNVIGAVVAISDKLDSLIELFKIGVKPTGNKDPFAQRRAAIGILRILEYYDVKMPIEEFTNDNSLLSFINERRTA